jgi:NADPH2:quinone reductase
MEAVWYEAQGAARDVLRVGRISKPVAKPGEVLVRVEASGVNPSDVKGRSGFAGSVMSFPRVVPHQDGAGVIDAVGEGISRDRVGERVWLYMAQWGRPFGTAAQWVALPAERAVALPAGTGFAEGAALGVPAMTAHRAVTCQGGVQSSRVLVRGVGAVGMYAVQWARRFGAARVVTTVRRAEEASLASLLGASAVVVSGKPTTQGEIDALGPFDRIIEVNFAANLEEDLHALAPGGVLVSYASDHDPAPKLPFRTLMSKNIVLVVILVYTMGSPALEAAARDINLFLADGMRHRIARTLPLREAVPAHELQERGAVGGKIVLTPWRKERVTR